MSDDTFELDLMAMAHGGHALGRHDKKTIFVPYTLPGERVAARIIQDKGRVAFAEGVTLLDASADRVYPRCAHFGPGRCGQCQWQHIDYPAQLLLKQDVLADQLARIGGFDDVAVQPVMPSPVIWEYNYHMTMVAGENGVPGFAAIDDERIILIDECPVMHPDLLLLYEALELQFDGLRRLRLQVDTEGDTFLTISMADDNAPALQLDLTASVNMLLSDNEPLNLIGSSHARYTLDDHGFRVTAGSFIRPNIAQIPNLTNAVVNLIGDAANVLDLYGGVGIFSAAFATNADLVTLIESYPPAVTDADVNLEAFDNVDLIEGTVEDVLPELAEAYDAAVLDPPARGLSVEVVDTLADLYIPRLVYVSSDPATLARDCKRLVQQGYRLGTVQPLDFAPHTYYIDSVAVLEI